MHEHMARPVGDDDDAPALPDHVRRHPDALVGMRGERVEKVLTHLGVERGVRDRGLARHAEQQGRADYVFDHRAAPRFCVTRRPGADHQAGMPVCHVSARRAAAGAGFLPMRRNNSWFVERLCRSNILH